jgi:hypothetical protein
MWQIKLLKGKQSTCMISANHVASSPLQKDFPHKQFPLYLSQNHGQASPRAITQDIFSTRFPNKTCMLDYLSQLVARIG